MSDGGAPAPAPAPRSGPVISGGTVGVVGDGTHIGELHMVTPRRELVWPVVVGQVPPLASAFQERNVAVGVDDTPGTVVLRQVVSGGGGVGKTQLAVGVFAKSVADVRVWVAAESRDAILTGYAQAAVRLDLADAEAGEPALAACFLGFLTGTDRSWLVVLDDVQDPADVQGLWPGGSGQVVVTTRRRDASLSGGGRRVVGVGVYTPDEAEAYLEQRLSQSAARLPAGALDEAGGLAADLGFLPLALSHAAAVIIDQALTTGEYRSLFADRRRTLVELFPAEADADGYARTVATTWDLAVQAADRLEPVGLARAMAQLVAVLDPAGVPEAVLLSDAACAYLGRTSDVGLVGPQEARRALRNLDRLSLVNHDPDTTQISAVRMHNLTGRAIVGTVDDSERARLVRAAADALVEVWPEIENNPTLSRVLRANAEVLTRTDADALWDEDSGGHTMLFEVGRSLAEAGLVGPAIDHYTALAEEALARLGTDHPDTLMSRSNLAFAYRAGGDLGRAVPLFEQVLADRERVLGAEHPDTLMSRSNLALAYQAGGDLGRAVPLLEEVLADLERVLGVDDPDTLISRNNLAFAYQAGGDLGRAVPLYEEVLADLERVLGVDDPDTLMSRSNLAFAYRAGGDLGRAVPLYEQVLADRQRVLGAEHPDTLMSRNNLAFAYQAGGDLGRAVSLYEHLLADQERVLGAEHPDTLISRNNLAYAHEAGGDLGRAVPLYEEVLADRERVLGANHPDTLSSRSNLAYACRAGGDVGRAISLFEQVLADRERVLGANHPQTLSSRNSLASAYQAGGDVRRAISLFEQAMADRERVLGVDHPDTLVSRRSLAIARRHV
jgi:tetratricopeptide (TPR) repeat protein